MTQLDKLVMMPATVESSRVTSSASVR